MIPFSLNAVFSQVHLMAAVFIWSLPLQVHYCQVILFTDDCKIFDSFPKSNLDFKSIKFDQWFLSEDTNLNSSQWLPGFDSKMLNKMIEIGF